MRQLIRTIGSTVATQTLANAITFSKMDPTTLESHFGKPGSRKSHSGGGVNGDATSATWHSMYDRRTGLVTLFDNYGGAIKGSPADAENFIGLLTFGALANIRVDGGSFHKAT